MIRVVASCAATMACLAGASWYGLNGYAAGSVCLASLAGIVLVEVQYLAGRVATVSRVAASLTSGSMSPACLRSFLRTKERSKLASPLDRNEVELLAILDRAHAAGWISTGVDFTDLRSAIARSLPRS